MSGNVTLEHVSCDCCKSDDYTVLYRKPDAALWINQFEFPVVKCNQCGLVYVNPRPTQEAMARYYPEEYHDGRNTDVDKLRYIRQLNYIPQLTNQKVLDVGCAKGDFLIFLKGRYPKISAVGIDYFSSKVNSNEIEFHNELLDEAKLEASSFDLITSWAVFEHLHQPSKYFKEVSRLLKENGEFVFLVTNSDSLYGKFAYREDVPRHTYHYSTISLKKYASDNDMSLKEIHFDDQIFDGRGVGSVVHWARKLIGVPFERFKKNKMSMIERLVIKLAAAIDWIVFWSHWESRLGRSGIMIVKMKKNDVKD